MQRLLLALGLLLALAIIGLAVVLALTERPPEPTADETALTSFRYESDEGISFTDDAARVARVQKGENAEQVVVDDEPGPAFTRVLSVTFGPQGRHIAYTAKQDSRFFVVADGEVSAPYDEIVRPPLFSPDGKHVAYVARLGRKQLLVLDGEQGAQHDSVWCSANAFRAEGEGILTVARDGGRECVVVDGTPGPWHDGIAWALIGPKGEIARVEIDGESHRLAVGDSVGAPFHGIGGLAFSPDGARVAYRAKRGNKWMLVVGNQEGQEYEAVSSPVFSPDGQRVVAVATEDGSQFVIDNKTVGVGYFKIRETRFAPDGRLTFIARSQGRDMMVIDGHAGPSFEALQPIVFGPKGSHFAYVARTGQGERVVVDHEAQPVFESVSPPRFSPDGAHVAYVATRGQKRSVVVDGKPGPPYDGVLWGGLRISKDGQRAVYTDAKTARWLMRLDPPIAPDYQGQTITIPRFVDGAAIEFIARRGRILLFVRQPVSRDEE